MEVGYRIAALLWAIACASFGASDAHVSVPVKASSSTSRDFSTTTTTPTSMSTTTTMAPEKPSTTKMESAASNTIMASVKFSTTTMASAEMSESNATETNLVDVPLYVPPEKSECEKARSEDFFRCLKAIGDNSMRHFETRNLTEFLADLCDPNVSKPHMDCVGEHFKACPDFLESIHVRLLQFGPYHVKDIIYFHSADHMCDCAIGLVCVQEYNKIRTLSSFTKTTTESPLVKIPDYKQICDPENGKWIDCVRKYLKKCDTALNRKFHAEFTLSHADEVKRMYDFRREHCNTVMLKDFDKENQCVIDFNKKLEYKQCLKQSQVGSPTEKLCGLRDCVENSMGRICNSSTVAVYVDAVNIFRHEKPRMLNFPCSSAVDVGVSILTLVIAVLIVLIY